jgi:hypothetical protein
MPRAAAIFSGDWPAKPASAISSSCHLDGLNVIDFEFRSDARDIDPRGAHHTHRAKPQSRGGTNG